jgi:hypothetical protein
MGNIIDGKQLTKSIWELSTLLMLSRWPLLLRQSPAT